MAPQDAKSCGAMRATMRWAVPFAFDMLVNSSKVRPAPQFPSDLGAESYKSWRMKFIHWMAQAIKMNIDEGLLWNELLTSMSKANSTAQHIVARMAPQDLASSGQAPNPWTG